MIRAVQMAGQTVRFHVPSKSLDERLDQFPIRDRDFAEWVDTLPLGAVLFDIGANIGTHALYAAAAGLRVVAFEPAEATLELLKANLALNGLGSKIMVLPYALTDVDGDGRLYMGKPDAGSVMHSFGRQMDCHGKPRAYAISQPATGMRLDTFVRTHGIEPDYLKIDVDGNEALVVRGAGRVLDGVREMIIELGPEHPEHTMLQYELQARGFMFDPAQVERSRKRFAKFSHRGFADYLFRR